MNHRYSQNKMLHAKDGFNLDTRGQISGRFDQSTLRPGQSEGLPGISPVKSFKISREADFAIAKSGLKNNEVRRCRPLLGTFVEIALGHDDITQAHAAINAAFGAIERVHNLMSFHDSASEVSVLNHLAADQGVSVSGETYQVLTYAKELHKRTQGIFDITIASELIAKGLLPNHAFLCKNYGGNTSDIELLPENFVRFLRPVCIDLGGIAKGFAVDQAVKVLQQNGVQNGLVNAGGDLRCFGTKEQTVWIRHGNKMSSSAILVKNTAVATSSVRTDSIFSRNLTSAAHIKMPSREILNKVQTVTVFADECILADALTKVVLLGSTELMEECLVFYKAKTRVFNKMGQLEKTIN